MTGDTFANIMIGRPQMTGQAFPRCPRVLAIKVAVDALCLGMGPGQWIEAMIKVVANKQYVLGFDSVPGGRFGIGDGHDLRGRRGSQQFGQLVQ